MYSTLTPHGVCSQSQLALVRVADVAAEPIRWLWPGRLPRGKVAVLDGDPGLGKSTVTLDLAARVSTAAQLPTGEAIGEAEAVVLLSAEDGVADTIRPRLEAAGAALDRIVVVDHVRDTNGGRPFAIPDDLDRLHDVIDDHGATLVVIDPLMAFLNGSIDAAKDQHVRRAFHRLKELAEQTGAAVIVVRHLNKSGGAQPIYRGGGSIGIIGAARTGLLVALDPDDESRRVLAVTKSNLAAVPKALAYRLVADVRSGVARVQWDGFTSHTAGDLLRVADEEDGAPARAEAERFLQDLLLAGPVPTKRVEGEARDAGISPRTLRRAREQLGIRPRRVGAPGVRGAYWEWSLRTTVAEDVHA